MQPPQAPPASGATAERQGSFGGDVAPAAKRDGLALIVANLAYALVGLITGAVTARALGAEGRGELAVMVLWPSIVSTLVDVGVGEAVTLRVARDKEALRAGLVSALAMVVGYSLVGVVAGVLTMPLVLQTNQLYLLDASRWAWLLVPANLLAVLSVGALMGLQRFRAVAVLRILSVIGYLAAVIAMVVAGRTTPEQFVWLTILSRALPIPLGFLFLISELSRSARRRLNIREQAADGARLHAARLAVVVGTSEDRAIATWTLLPVAIGYWNVAAALMFLLPFVAQGLSQQLFARIAAGQPQNTRDLVVTAYVRTVLVTAAMAAILAPLMPWVVPLVFGADFRPAVGAAVIVTVASVFAAGMSSLQAGARAIMRNGICVEAEAAAIVVMAALSWPTVKFLGLAGLAVSYLGGRAVGLGWMLLRGRRVFGWRPSALIPGAPEFMVVARAEVGSVTSAILGYASR